MDAGAGVKAAWKCSHQREENTMSNQSTRREFFNEATGITAVALLAAHGLAGVHRGGDDTIQVALVGCGGRGTGAAQNALSVTRGPMKLVAMADVFEDRQSSSYNALSNLGLSGVEVPPERRFIGFDAYRRAMDTLQPGDVVILATPPAFRWVHLSYAIEKGLNVFMEKPLSVDGPSSRKMLDLAERARQKNLKVAVGLMSRHSRALEELSQRVQAGEIGEIISQHGYRMQGAIASFRSTPVPAGMSELEYQIRRFHSFLWASGGGYNDFFIHIIDQLCWMKGAWPIKAQALGGRHYKTRKDGVPYVDQNFDTYAVEYTYPDGTSLIFDGRNIEGAQERFSSFMHGTKGSAIVSSNGDCGLPSRIFSRHDMSRESMVWNSKVAPRERNPYQNEWNDLIDAIRDGTPYNEAKRGIEASLVCNMGRMAAHTGREITFEQMLESPHEFAPGLAEMTKDSPAPLLSDAEGRYPVPQPGIVTDREY
jgi:predicted dehydrogenase